MACPLLLPFLLLAYLSNTPEVKSRYREAKQRTPKAEFLLNFIQLVSELIAVGWGFWGFWFLVSRETRGVILRDFGGKTNFAPRYFKKSAGVALALRKAVTREWPRCICTRSPRICMHTPRIRPSVPCCCKTRPSRVCPTGHFSVLAWLIGGYITSGPKSRQFGPFPPMAKGQKSNHFGDGTCITLDSLRPAYRLSALFLGGGPCVPT